MTRHVLARAVGLLVVALLVLTAGCSKPPKKRQFNNILARRNAEHATAAKDFYAKIKPLSTGQMVSSEARTALTKCQEVLSATQSRMLDLSPPRGSSSGRDYYSVYKDYVASQQKIYDECFVPIVKIVEDNRQYPTPGHKWAAISPLLEKAEQIERPAYDALTRAQQEFSKAHGFAPK